MWFSANLGEKCLFQVDEEDADKIAPYRWTTRRSRSSGKPYIIRYCGKRALRLANIIMGLPNGIIVDHINGDSLDNRRINLRIATNAENLRNRGKNKNNTSGFKGVIYDKKAKNWRASIMKNGKTYHLGGYNTKIEAAIVYNEAASNMFGCFAWLNPIPQQEEGY